MAEVQRKVSILSHTQLSSYLIEELTAKSEGLMYYDEEGELNYINGFSDGQAVALTAIRTCYSPGKPSEIVEKEGKRYFGAKATDGGTGTEANRLIRMIKSSGHTSTLEHISFTFAVEGVSRSLLAQLTRHRIGTGFSVQSQRYVKFGSDDKSGGFDYVVPTKIKENPDAYSMFKVIMENAQANYDDLRSLKVPAEDARAVLPNAASCNLTFTINLRALLDYYGKRKHGAGAQSEIADFTEDLKREVIKVEPWTEELFG